MEPMKGTLVTCDPGKARDVLSEPNLLVLLLRSVNHILESLVNTFAAPPVAPGRNVRKPFVNVSGCMRIPGSSDRT